MYGGRLKFSKILEKGFGWRHNMVSTWIQLNIWVTHYNDTDQIRAFLTCNFENDSIMKA